MSRANTFNLPTQPATLERLHAIAYLTRHTGPSAVARRLVELYLVEEPQTIPVPEEPEVFGKMRKPVFLSLGKDCAAAVQEKAASYGIAAQRFAVYTVEYAVTDVAREEPVVDQLCALRADYIANLTRGRARYLPE